MYYVTFSSQSRIRDSHNVGSTSNLKQRLKEHNEGRSPHTAKFRPWVLVAYFAFANEKTAIFFEKSLKSGSDRAFVNRHFI